MSIGVIKKEKGPFFQKKKKKESYGMEAAACVPTRIGLNSHMT